MTTPTVPARAAVRRPQLPPGAHTAAITLTSVITITLLAGALPWLTGSDPAHTVLRARHTERDADPAALAAIRTELRLPDNPLTGALTWLSHALHGDLGTSWVSGKEVSSVVTPALLISTNLAATAALTTLAVAALLITPRLLSLAHGHTHTRPTLPALAGTLAALPEAVVAVTLAWIFAIHFRWLPAVGWREPRDMILPVSAIALSSSGILTRILLDAVTTIAAEDWVDTWRANGARPARLAALIAHRALAVVLPQVMLLFAGIVGASVIVEDTFAVPGLGRLCLQASLAQDIPVVQGCVAALVVVGALVGAAGMVAHRLLLGPALGAGRGVAGVRRVAVGGPSRLWWAAVAALTVLVVGGWCRSAQIMPGERHLSPSWTHPWGTDHVGRDVWARVGQGAFFTVGTALLLSFVVVVIGVAVGLSSREGSGIADVLNAVPSVFLGLVVAAVAGPGMLSAAVAICVVAWIPLAVHARTLAVEARASGYHQAALVAGAGRWWIIWHHLLPTVMRPVTVHALMRVPHVALALTGLGYLGLGAGHDSPEWGMLLAESVLHLERAPWAVAAPAVGLVLLGLVANLWRAE
ncbi:hypothetical protein KEM60_00442 [Austwickia sp. TVS 96-490-7B]|uniref:ABC transporter permease subunit n=1 Tax=Austwickia sp. TVS 96-490-7B TaxID=2830843 RepID=UPI001C5797A7|nr:ABC transporter permease subunit [Austwickia sp. TVS 96-490-7B]MBW3084255.1 hypothetical protein [Austwickia sp. TVS 96-490-7B]